MWLNNCSNLASVFLGCRGRWPAAGYQALCMARLPNPAQGACFPALQEPCRCSCCTLQVFFWGRGKNWQYARYFCLSIIFSSATSWQMSLREMVNYHCSLLRHVDQVTVLHSVRGCSWNSSVDLPCSLLDRKGKEGRFWDSVVPVSPQRWPSPFSCIWVYAVNCVSFSSPLLLGLWLERVSLFCSRYLGQNDG